MSNQTEKLDILIIGAGIAGLGMAYNMLKNRKGDSFAVIESRDNIGGTWDYFKYPGLRTDSDMYTYAYSFKPLRSSEYIGSAERLKGYLNELVEEHNIEEKIRFQTRITSADWSSQTNTWTLVATKRDGNTYLIETKFLITCTGYYDYEGGYSPKFEGSEDFKGDIIHTQKWPENYDYKNKNVIVIGSGATAFTVVPTMAKDTAHITMLQRSPGYVFSRPSTDGLYTILSKFLPAGLTNRIMRMKYLSLLGAIYGMSKGFPNLTRKLLLKGVRKASNNQVDVDKHFSPSYKPWDQRVCMVPDNDMFEAIKCGDASIRTEEIKRFTKKGILLKNGEELSADLIVTATGLKMQFWGGMNISVDGVPVPPNSITNYKGLMFSQIPNMVTVFGSTTSSWTVKAEISYGYICRLLNFMEDKKFKSVFPYQTEESESAALVSLTSGYVQRAKNDLPKQGTAFPWSSKDFYFTDLLKIKRSKLDDGVLVFDKNALLADFHGANKAPDNTAKKVASA
ncbi:MAG: NAD(P)/FAD-dependent oxidoreductase [Bermanella sp.]